MNKILNFLSSQEDETGKIVDGGITDWSTMNFVANHQQPNGQLINYLYNYNFSSASELNLCASYPRHLLALKSAGYQNNNVKIIELKNYILNDCYVNNQYGQAGINDDIFALMALLNVGIDKNKNIIQDIVSTILADQNNAGAFTWNGWAGADITGAVINALKYAENFGINISNEIFTKAKNYLKSQQKDDGGWGYTNSDVLTTSWVMMGINSLNETQNDWWKNHKNPWDILINNLKDNGSYESTYNPGTIDWFAVKHAVPALLGKSWPIDNITTINNESNSSSTNGNGGNGNNNSTNPISTSETDTSSTTKTTTTTIDFTSSTLEKNTTSTIKSPTSSFKNSTTTLKQKISSTSSLKNTLIKLNLKTKNKKQKTKLLISKTKKKIKKEIISKTINTKIKTNTTTQKQNYKLNNKHELLTSTSTTLPYKKTAKDVFDLALASTSGLGLYLGWRFLLNLI